MGTETENGSQSSLLERGLRHLTWIELQDLFLAGGKLAKSFSSTGLIWNVPVGPLGICGQYDFIQSSGWSGYTPEAESNASTNGIKICNEINKETVSGVILQEGEQCLT